MSKDIIPSKYQADFFDLITTTHHNAFLDAVAGSGKTKTIVDAIDLIPAHYSKLFCAFNRHIVKELKSRISALNTQVSTIHGVGSRALYKTFKSDLYELKYKDLYATLSQTWKISGDDPMTFRERVLKLCDLGRLNMCALRSEMHSLVIRYGIEVEGNEVEYAIELIQEGRRITNKIDFTDMVYLPNYYNLSIYQYDVVFVDEAQDLNKAQRMLALRAVKPSGRIFFVGDVRQAIYGFAGSDAKSVEAIKSLPNMKIMPLSFCYRCPKVVIDLVNDRMPNIAFEAPPGAKEGTLIMDGTTKDVRDGDFVLCRTTMPLVKLCMEILVSGQKAVVKGRDVAKSLIAFLKKSHSDSIDELNPYFTSEREKALQRLMRFSKMTLSDASEHQDIVTFDERVMIYTVLSPGLKTVRQLIDKIDSIFNDENSEGVTLSTIHRAKGLEANRIHILQPEILPAPWAKLPEDKVQEENLWYVAVTRTKDHLSFITDFDAYGGKFKNRKDKEDIRENPREHPVVRGTRYIPSIDALEFNDGL